jgi:hypothetical protein
MLPPAKSLSVPVATRGSISPLQSNIPLVSANEPVSKARKRPQRLPPWDREVDVTFHKDPPVDTNGHVPAQPKISEHTVKRAIETEKKKRREYRDLESHTYAAIISILNYQEKRKDSHNKTFAQVIGGLYLHHKRAAAQKEISSFFKLPDEVRQRIWRYVVFDGSGDSPKPICLQAFDPFLKAVWLQSEFQSTNDLISPIQSALAACFAMRADLLAYILSTHRFHFTFSPYVRQKTCPELFGWIEEYSHLMQFVTIELDLSKMGFGADPAAVRLLPGNLHINTAVGRWVDVQLARRTMPIQSLVLLARRYHGLRPTTERPFCHPAGDHAAAAPILRLSGKMDTLRLRIAGFNASTTEHIIAAIFPDVRYKATPEILKHCQRAGISTIWPFLPHQASNHRDAQYRKPAPRKEIERTSQLMSPARRVSLARRQITKLKEMLAANDEQMRNSETSIENATKIPLSTWGARRNTHNPQLHAVSVPERASGNSFERKSTELSVEQKRVSKYGASSMQRHSRNPSEEQKRLSNYSTKSILKHSREPSEEQKRLSNYSNKSILKHSREPSEEQKRLSNYSNKSILKHSREPSEEQKRMSNYGTKSILKHSREPSEEQKRMSHHSVKGALKHSMQTSEEQKRMSNYSVKGIQSHSREPSEEQKMMSSYSFKSMQSHSREPSEEQKRVSNYGIKSIRSEHSEHSASKKLRDSGLGLDMTVEKEQSVTTLKRNRSFTSLLRRASLRTRRYEA